MTRFILVALSFLLSHFAIAQDDIADMRANFNVGQTVTVTGIVTHGGELGSIRYIQDNTAGVAIYPGANWDNLDFVPQPGDEISVTGVISQFANLLEVGPNISNLTLVSAGNPSPTPILLSPNELNETYEGMLVQVNGAEFSDGGSVFGSSTYNFISDGEQAVIYLPTASPLIGELIPLGTVDIIGVLSQFSFDNPAVGYQILPRSSADLFSENAINFTTGVEQDDLTTSGFSLSWGTDVASNTGVFYGTTSALGETMIIEETTIDHSIVLGGLESGKPYFCQVFSVAGSDTAKSTIRVYSTVSESSGDIKVYFNRAVDTSVSTGVDAISLFNATDDTLAAYIDRTLISLDVAVYNNNNGPIVQAINNALDRGVVVRYIAEGQNANTALASLDASIPVVMRENATSSGMHNKFMIIDAEDVDNAIVVTGSTNFTSNNLFSDPNNMVIVQDQALARAYTLEFNEMWGSDGAEPDLDISRFGELKINNTPEKFIIGGRRVELYFSPTDNTTAAIEKAIQTSNYNLDFALLILTSDILAEAIAGEVNLFLTPRGIVESPFDSGSDFTFLADQGVQMLSHEGVPGQLHHKYATIDYSQPESDPTVVTGSHNWSASAESVNDENTLIIHDATIANLFYQEFTAIYNGLVVGTENEVPDHLVIFPNPATDSVTLLFDSPRGLPATLALTDIQGKIIYTRSIQSFSGQNKVELDVRGLAEGVYQLSLSGKWGKTTETLVVAR